MVTLLPGKLRAVQAQERTLYYILLVLKAMLKVLDCGYVGKYYGIIILQSESYCIYSRIQQP